MSVWPDARIKSSPIFTKVAQKGAKVVFVSKERFFKSQKKLPNIWFSFVLEYILKTLKSSTIWHHCI